MENQFVFCVKSISALKIISFMLIMNLSSMAKSIVEMNNAIAMVVDKTLFAFLKLYIKLRTW